MRKGISKSSLGKDSTRFIRHHASRAAPTCSQWQPRLSEEEKDCISGNASEEEFKAALWSLKAFNAPRPDGLHVGFF